MRPTGASGEGSSKRNPQTKRIAGQREHVSELTATENADGHEDFLDLVARCSGRFFLNRADTEGSGASRTRLV